MYVISVFTVLYSGLVKYLALKFNNMFMVAIVTGLYLVTALCCCIVFGPTAPKAPSVNLIYLMCLRQGEMKLGL